MGTRCSIKASRDPEMRRPSWKMRSLEPLAPPPCSPITGCACPLQLGPSMLEKMMEVWGIVSVREEQGHETSEEPPPGPPPGPHGEWYTIHETSTHVGGPTDTGCLINISSASASCTPCLIPGARTHRTQPLRILYHWGKKKLWRNTTQEENLNL